MKRRMKVTMTSSRRLPIKTGHLFILKAVITPLTDRNIQISAENTVLKNYTHVFK